jgi:hypothetical protein
MIELQLIITKPVAHLNGKERAAKAAQLAKESTLCASDQASVTEVNITHNLLVFASVCMEEGV